MHSGEIAKINGYKVDDVIVLYGNAYRLTYIGDVEVHGIKVVENGINVESNMVLPLNLKLPGWGKLVW
jgi:hypothetical protein